MGLPGEPGDAKRGPKGLKGEQGDAGDPGPPGKFVQDGEEAVEHPSIFKGRKGPQGARGDHGLRGQKGEVGPKGPQVRRLKTLLNVTIQGVPFFVCLSRGSDILLAQGYHKRNILYYLNNFALACNIIANLISYSNTDFVNWLRIMVILRVCAHQGNWKLQFSRTVGCSISARTAKGESIFRSGRVYYASESRQQFFIFVDLIISTDSQFNETFSW